jgi:3-methyladenine DNA glycosylase AlkD
LALRRDRRSFVGDRFVSANVSRLEQRLKKLGTPERAAGEKRYLKSEMRFLGATLADIRREVKELWRAEAWEHDELLAVASELWETGIFELRMAAALLLELGVDELDSEDVDFLERFIREAKTWALVDVLAGDVVGRVNLQRRIKGKLDRWARDDDFWIRRAALLAELIPLEAGRPFAPFAARADRMLDEKEFFIRKAIGWVLRETSKKRPDEVYRWIRPRAHRASGVTMREVVKYLDKSRASRLP